MSRIMIVGPASPTPENDKDKIIAYFEDLGHTVQFAPHCFDCDRFLAGSDIHRAEDINNAFSDDNVDIIMALRGGYGSPRLLDKLDYKTISKNKKPFFGFSDITAMQLALWHQAQLVSFSGFNANFAARPIGPLMQDTLQKALNKKPISIKGLKCVVPGTAYAPVVGGTLTMLCGLLGTPYMPSLKETILVIEDVHEEPYRIDRMLNQLRLAGALSQLQGIVLAGCEDCIAKDKADGDVMTVFMDYFEHKKIPVVTQFPYGHTPDHIVFPIGQPARLDANQGTLVFDKFK